jgi:hypothetical protein
MNISLPQWFSILCHGREVYNMPTIPAWSQQPTQSLHQLHIPGEHVLAVPTLEKA